jgi:hypothetical protein
MRAHALGPHALRKTADWTPSGCLRSAILNDALNSVAERLPTARGPAAILNEKDRIHYVNCGYLMPAERHSEGFDFLSQRKHLSKNG